MNKVFPWIILISLLFLNCSKNDSLPNTTQEFIVPATQDIVMYEINIGSFSPSGNLNGITQRLDNIQALGINTIWLMPIHPIGSVISFGSPYCVKDYRAVNPEIGNLDEIKI